MNRSLRCAIAGTVALAASSMTPLAADPQLPAAAPTIKRTILNRIDVPGSAYEVVYALVEIAPNSTVARHTHPGTVFGYLLDGDYTLVVTGQPPRTLRIGETLEVPPGVVHEEHTGVRAAKILAVFTVEKGKPPSSPAP